MKTSSIVFLFILLTAVQSFGHTSYQKEVKCPIDGKKFTINITMSYTTFSSTKDFEKQGAIGDLYESMINSCPKCHYCGYEDDFDTTFTETMKADISKIILPYESAKMNDVIECEIAAQIHLYFKKKNDEIGGIYLVASYFLRTSDSQVAKRKELQLQSIAYFQKALDGKEYEKKEAYATINYLVGELYRRVGKFDEAIRYFDLAINDENKKDWVKDVAEEQKKLGVDKDENNNL